MSRARLAAAFLGEPTEALLVGSFFAPRRTRMVIAIVTTTGTKIESPTTTCVQPLAV